MQACKIVSHNILHLRLHFTNERRVQSSRQKQTAELMDTLKNSDTNLKGHALEEIRKKACCIIKVKRCSTSHQKCQDTRSIKTSTYSAGRSIMPLSCSWLSRSRPTWNLSLAKKTYYTFTSLALGGRKEQMLCPNYALKSTYQ